MNQNLLKEQGIPLVLTVATFFALTAVLYIFILALNLLPTTEKIILELRWQDVAVGLTIYLKTSIDFAIFIGNLMRTNPGWKKRIAIEVGTSVGNAAGTLLILLIWNFFREVPILMAIMIIIASLVLLRMAEESIEAFTKNLDSNHSFRKPVLFIEEQLRFVNSLFHPFIGRLIPNLSITNIKTMSFMSLLIFSFSIPFILGLDDFAGYIPLFSIINVFGFAVGVFLGHMILNIALFISPNSTTKIVRLPVILIFGGLAFIGIASWGFYEALKLLLSLI